MADEVDIDAISVTMANRARSASRRRADERKDAKKRRGYRALNSRAEWIVLEWSRHPSYGYSATIKAVRERFHIGQTAAEQAYKRALEMHGEVAAGTTIERLIAVHWELLERANELDKISAAARIAWSLAQITGAIKQPSINVTAGAVTIQQLAHANVVAMTPTRRAQRERELEAAMEQRMASLVGGNPIDVVSSATEVIDQHFGSFSDDEDDGR